MSSPAHSPTQSEFLLSGVAEVGAVGAADAMVLVESGAAAVGETTLTGLAAVAVMGITRVAMGHGHLSRRAMNVIGPGLAFVAGAVEGIHNTDFSATRVSDYLGVAAYAVSSGMSAAVITKAILKDN